MPLPSYLASDPKDFSEDELKAIKAVNAGLMKKHELPFKHLLMLPIHMKLFLLLEQRKVLVLLQRVRLQFSEKRMNY